MTKRVRIFGPCDDYTRHSAHILDVGACLQDCPGQHSECRNCDDRKCMGCVTREWGHDCRDDCPDCCAA